MKICFTIIEKSKETYADDNVPVPSDNVKVSKENWHQKYKSIYKL